MNGISPRLGKAQRAELFSVMPALIVVVVVLVLVLDYDNDNDNGGKGILSSSCLTYS
ncbi:MAG: hypothetical protein KFB96_22430 [Thiocapsa sp.]|uniref:hypothetical protein n=1 Tax=Thiocapsa sp. TaxID=2024551 RepID=UPI001BCB2277|nr:hypothetical protein [Thiocapsa sp.]QVL48337.1 MAG: hypothetical protein KFB96_22430 [Thiocapsa sp.]